MVNKFPYGSLKYVNGDIKAVKEFLMKKIKIIGIIALVAAIVFLMVGCPLDKPCPSCDGSGKCGSCNGIGYYAQGGSKCTQCDGSGVCKYCGGSGKANITNLY
jgi:hypothetical protein